MINAEYLSWSLRQGDFILLPSWTLFTLEEVFLSLFSVIGNNLVFYYYLKFYKFHLKFEIPLRVTFSKQLFDDEGAYSF